MSDLDKYYDFNLNPSINDSKVIDNLKYLYNVKCWEEYKTRRAFVKDDNIRCYFNFTYKENATYHLINVRGYWLNESGEKEVTNHAYSWPYEHNYYFPLEAESTGFNSYRFDFYFNNKTNTELWYTVKMNEIYIYPPEEYIDKENEKLFVFLAFIPFLMISLPIGINNIKEILKKD